MNSDVNHLILNHITDIRNIKMCTEKIATLTAKSELIEIERSGEKMNAIQYTNMHHCSHSTCQTIHLERHPFRIHSGARLAQFISH